MKPIKNYENYLIDENGNVYNSITKKELKGSVGENGYRYYRLSKNNKKKMFYAHRLVAETFLENLENLPVVNHIDGNKLNNNVNNLEWTTYSENTFHWRNNNNIQRRPIEYYQNDLPNEQWKEFKGYLISSKGRVRHKEKNNLLKPSIACGYYKIRLSQNGMVTDYLIHKLVYQLFNDDYDNLKIIDHIDGNKLNNDIYNLRQVSLSENVSYSLYEQKTNSSAKRVGQYDLNNNFIKDFPSARIAAKELGLDSSTISKVCRGKNKTHGGFIFKYL